MSKREQWVTIREIHKIMKGMRKTMRELDSLMIIAQREICQPKLVEV
jgi:hypothetical protein